MPENRLLQAYRHRRQAAANDALPADLAGNIRYFANPGPEFEERQTPDTAAEHTRAKAIAFYLPQFHAFPENDAWWGAGFTEWRNVARGTPRFQGHYQPRIPRDLGFYDLNNVDVLKAQAALARAAGIQSFCFYYYWFNGKRLMDKPLDLFASEDIDQEFCILWANENWTRRWDGRDEDVLIAQEYDRADEDDFIADTARYMAHPRYTAVDGRPLFILYRPALLPDATATIARWRDKWTAILGVTPLVYMVQSYTEFDPRNFDCDGALEFPPHKVSQGLPRINSTVTVLDPAYSGQVRAYTDVIDKSLSEPAPDYPLIKTVSPHWDNDARREARGVTFHGSTPEHYSRWLNGAIDFARRNPVGNQPLVFINAWNEWAEAAYLEPDVHYGHAYLNATYRTLTGATSLLQRSSPVLLVGHDAHANGAQMLLLNIARLLTSELGLSIRILLKSGGALVSEYQRIAPTTLLAELTSVSLEDWFKQCGCERAIFNTTVTGDLLEPARAAGITTVSLVHEMPALIRDYALQAEVSDIAHLSNHVVFASDVVKAGFEEFEPVIKSAVTIRPQGLYKQLQISSQDRQRIRKKLGVEVQAKLVLNVGYADNRKGFDVFVELAQHLCAQDSQIHFCWVGKRGRSMNRWLTTHIGKSLKGRLHLIDFTEDIAPWFAAADALYLSSREDPFPSVVLEAMSIGLPVLLHTGTTGFDEAVLQHVAQAPLADISELHNALSTILSNECDVERQARMDYVQKHFRLQDYATALLQLMSPNGGAAHDVCEKHRPESRTDQPGSTPPLTAANR